MRSARGHWNPDNLPLGEVWKTTREVRRKLKTRRPKVKRLQLQNISEKDREPPRAARSEEARAGQEGRSRPRRGAGGESLAGARVYFGRLLHSMSDVLTIPSVGIEDAVHFTVPMNMRTQ